jgi:hypothetical protein
VVYDQDVHCKSEGAGDHQKITPADGKAPGDAKQVKSDGGQGHGNPKDQPHLPTDQQAENRDQDDI